MANLLTGNTNYLLNVTSIDEETLAGNEYLSKFSVVPKIESGDLATKVTTTVINADSIKPYKYTIEFTSASTFNLMNVTLNELLREGYGYQFGGRDLTRTDLG